MAKKQKVLAHDLQPAGLLLRRVTLPVPGGGGPGPPALDSACLLPSGARPFANGENDATVGKGGRSPSDPRDGDQPNTPGSLLTASRQFTPLSQLGRANMLAFTQPFSVSSLFKYTHTSGLTNYYSAISILVW